MARDYENVSNRSERVSPVGSVSRAVMMSWDVARLNLQLQLDNCKYSS